MRKIGNRNRQKSVAICSPRLANWSDAEGRHCIVLRSVVATAIREKCGATGMQVKIVVRRDHKARKTTTKKKIVFVKTHHPTVYSRASRRRQIMESFALYTAR